MAQIEIKGIIGEQYTYKQFITDFANARGEVIDLLIDSPGGSVQDGEQIQNFILSKQEQFRSVRNSGDVASIAASIFLALPFEKRFFDMAKGVPLIHNPYVGDTTGMDTTANGLKTASEHMAIEEDKICKFIAKQTNSDKDVIGAMMAVNEPLSESQMVAINFANIIKFQAVAFLNTKQTMKKEEVQELIEKSNESFLDKIKALFAPKAKALMVTIADGTMVNFPDVADGAEPKAGDKITKDDGSALPDGEIILANGDICVVAGGTVSEIKPAVADETENMDELAKLKAELEALKATQNKVVFDLKAQIKSQMLTIEEQVKAERTSEKTEPEKFTYNGRKK